MTITSSNIHFIPPATVGTTGQVLTATDNVGGTAFQISSAPIYPISATNGGTGISNPTATGIMVAEGAAPMHSIPLSDGQLLIGASGLDPIAAQITGISGRGIDVVNASGFIGLGSNKNILPFNTIEVYVSKLIGDDITGTGSYSNPFQTLTRAQTLINSLSHDSTLIIMDDQLYDEQLNFTSGFQVNIFGPSAEIEFSGIGDTLTFNSNTLSFVRLGALTAANGNGLVNNAGTVIAYAGGLSGSINAALANNSGIWLEAVAATAGNLNTSAGGNIFAQIGQFFGVAGPGASVQTISSTNTDWNVGGLSTDAILGNSNFTINSSSINFTNLGAAGHVPIITSPTVTAQYQITGITLNGVSGTNFSGIGGDRNLIITDGTNVWVTISAAILQAFAGSNALWGSLSLPLPTTIDMSQFSVAGTNIYAAYANGSTDYTAGSLTISLQYTRVAL